MSNKIGINLKKLFFLFSLWFVMNSSFAFEPDLKNFVNHYQYELYHSWLQNDDFETDFPAGFSAKKIATTFQTQNGNQIKVEYDWKNHQIYDQREVLPFIFLLPENIKLDRYIKYLESMIYRLNAANKKFFLDFVDIQKIELHYGNYVDQTALEVLRKAFLHERVLVDPIKLDVQENMIFFFIPTQKKEIKIGFETDLDLTALRAEIKKIEKQKIPEKIKPKIIAKIKPSPKDPEEFVESKPDEPEKKKRFGLAKFIAENYHQPPARELLNNKIQNIDTFIKEEFPDFSIRKIANKYILKGPNVDGRIFSDLRFEVITQNDGLEINPSIDHDILDDNMILNTNEKISLSNLDSDETDMIVPFIPQLVYAHRALGSKLLNFLLIHDDIPTTLVLRSDKREVFDLPSYADLLLLLNFWWENRQIFFSLTEIKKKNGDIEMQGFLVAQNPKQKDLAEILFHFNQEYKMDLIMMKLYVNE